MTAEDLRKCKAPTLFIFGENEGARDEIDAVRKVLGPTAFKVVPGGNHITTPGKPEFGATIVAFLHANMSHS